MKKAIFCMALAMVLLVGCAAQKPTREDALAMRRSYDQTRTRIYEKKTVNEVLDAVHELFTLADVDYLVSHSETGCMAYRDWSVFLVFGFEAGKDYWYVSAEEVANGTKIIIREITYRTAYMATPAGARGAQMATIVGMANPDLIELDEMKSKPTLYRMFFKRLDYLLGAKEMGWPDCYNEWMKYGQHCNGCLEPLCSVASDRRPN